MIQGGVYEVKGCINPKIEKSLHVQWQKQNKFVFFFPFRSAIALASSISMALQGSTWACFILESLI